MKKVLLPLFTMALGAITASAAVGDVFSLPEAPGVKYKVISPTEVEVNDVDYSSVTAVTLTETVSYDGTDYTLTSIGDRAFYYCKITEITIPNTVTSLAYGAFMSCDNLSKITFGTGLKTIGDYCFYGDPFTEMTIPEGVESVGGSCFFTAKKLTKVVFPSTLKSLGASCFYNSPLLEEVVLPAGLETLGAKAFMRCGKLSKVNIPEGVKVIGEGTFYECKSLTSIDLPAGLETIGKESFWGSGLTSISIPAAVTEIGGAAFSGTKIEKYQVDPANKSFTTVDDILYTADKTLLIALPPVYGPASVTVDPACLGISYGAFDCANVTNVTLGNKVRAIDECAFVNSKLSTINLPESVVFIGEQAFAGTQLTDVVLPKNLPLIQDGSFAQVTTLKSVTIPASVKEIAIRAFTLCPNLTTINCEGMTPPVLEDWYETYENPFANCPSSAVVNVPVGALNAYLASNWKSAFSASQIRETLPAALVLASADPAAGSNLVSFDGVTLTFSENVSIASSSPAIKVVKGRLVAGVPVGDPVSVDDWMMVKSGDKGVRIFPADYDGFTSPFNMESGYTYFVTIPAGAVKNASGTASEEIVLNYEGAWVKPVVKFIDADPAVDSELEEISTLALNFEESVSLQTSKLGQIKVYEGAVEDGEVVDSYWTGVYGQTTGTSIAIFSSDPYGEGFAEPLALADGKDYYVVLPEGLFRLSSSYSTQSPEIVLHYKGPEAVAFAITDITPADGETLETFEHMTLSFTEMAVFNETVAEQVKAYYVFPGDEITDGEQIRTMDFWSVPENYSNELMLFASDMDGFVVPIPLNTGRDLYIVLPEGLFTTLNGQQKTPETILHYLAPAAKFEIVGISPEDGESMASFDGMTFTFSEMAVYQESVGQNIKAVKAASADKIAEGQVVTSVDFWACPENYSSELRIFPSDWDGFTVPISISGDADLFIVIPEGTFTNLSGTGKTPEMTVHYTNEMSGVSSVGVNDGNLVVEVLPGAVKVVADKYAVYNVAGQLVAAGEGEAVVSLVAGIYTVRATGAASEVKIAKVLVK